MDDIYKVNTYSDKELYDILDLVNPSDRELEAKILHMIWKYDNMGNSQHLSTFFRGIYDHFFEEDDTPSPTPTIEGFTTEDINTTAIGSGTTVTPGSNINELPTSKPAAEKEKKDDKAILGYSFPLDYTKDSLNPLLKQTTKRIVSIDSQYREKSKYPLSSQYTFNLSNPLKDVVNLRLYSIQIPYTWYTINDSYGSNFFYLKGNSPGIENGLHDIKVEIGIGNYTAPDLITTVNKSITALKSDAQYTDISFGTTAITYDSANSLSTLDVNIKNRYAESFYSIEFSEWTTPRSNIVNKIDITARDASIPAFLGFDVPKYNAFSLISSLDSLPYPVPETDSTLSSYKLDASNNYITIIQYLPNNGDSSIEYTTNPSKCTILETIKVTLSLAKIPTAWSKKSITEDLIVQLGLHPKLFKSSISRIQTNSILGKSYYSLDIRLNRKTTANVKNSKVAIVFHESTNPAISKIWTGPGSIFEFENDKNELNTILSKVRTVQEQIKITSSPVMYFTCIKDYFNGRTPSGNPINTPTPFDPSLNDFFITVPNGIYTLNTYISKLNELLYATEGGIVNNNKNTCGISINSSSYMDFKMDINKQFGRDYFTIDMSGTFLSNTLKLTSVLSDLSGNNMNVFEGTFDIEGSGYTINTGTLMTLRPKSTAPNRFVPAYVIPPLELRKTYGDISDLLNGLKAAINGFIDTVTGNQLMAGTIITITQRGSKATIKMIINLQTIITESAYRVSFIDSAATGWDVSEKTNSWSYNLKIADQAFNWNDIRYNVPGTSFSQYTSSPTKLLLDTIELNDENNIIRLDPTELINGGDGIYTNTFANSIVIKLKTLIEYSRDDLFAEINKQLDANPITKGTTFTGYTALDGNDYTKIRFNINKIYDSSDYRVVFYDPLSFAKCNAGSSSVRNTTWDSTLGWTIGFRDKTEYNLSETSNIAFNNDYYNSTYKTARIVGDTTVSVSIYNYFMIVLDDYNQSHMNAGVVTTTQSETDIPLPAYTNRSLIRCDPITKTKITDIISNTGANLTRSSIYAQQVITNEKEAAKKTKQYAKGPFTKDVFALVPLKLAGLPNNSVYVESGGTLQDQERTYFGPVNISRMTVKLVNDRGELVNLNGANWSFSFICEQLYKK